MLLGLPAGDGVKEATNNEKVRQLHKPSRTLLCIFLSCALPLALCEALGADQMNWPARLLVGVQFLQAACQPSDKPSSPMGGRWARGLGEMAGVDS